MLSGTTFTQLAMACSKLTIETLQICSICEICSKLTIKIKMAWRRSGVFIVDFDYISHLELWACKFRLGTSFERPQPISGQYSLSRSRITGFLIFPRSYPEGTTIVNMLIIVKRKMRQILLTRLKAIRKIWKNIKNK